MLIEVANKCVDFIELYRLIHEPGFGSAAKARDNISNMRNYKDIA